jgi:hypothetical protein
MFAELTDTNIVGCSHIAWVNVERGLVAGSRFGEFVQ